MTVSAEEQERRDRSKAYLDYATATYDAEYERYELLDGKAARYMTMLTFVVGSANLVLLRPLLEAARASTRPFWQDAFLFFGVTLVLSGVIGMACSFACLSPRTVKGRPVRNLRDAFMTQFTIEEANAGLADELLDGAQQIRRVNSSKAFWLTWAFIAGVAAMIMLAGTLFSFLKFMN